MDSYIKGGMYDICLSEYLKEKRFHLPPAKSYDPDLKYFLHTRAMYPEPPSYKCSMYSRYVETHSASNPDYMKPT